MIKVKFRDGTTELRFETSPCRHDDEHAKLFWHGLVIAWEDAVHYADVHNLTRCGRGRRVSLWRLNPSEEGEPLTGRWEMAYVETVNEQIVRIEGERDAAIARAKVAEDFVCSACGGKNKWKGGIAYEAPEETS